MRVRLLPAALGACLALLAGCGQKEEPSVSGDGASADEERLATRTIRIDGPEVLQPLSSAAARNFEMETPVEVEVDESGTETALEKLCSGRIAIAGARRPMNAAERELCAQRGIAFRRVKIANHAVAVAVSEELAVRCLTMRQLGELWEPGSRVTRLSQLDGSLPAKRLELYGPTVGRDDFALFTALVNGEPGAIRSRWGAAANRSALSARLEANDNALAFYNLAELSPAHDGRLIAIDDGGGCVRPTTRNVQTGRYPLQEDLYLYVSEPELERPRVRSFTQYFVEDYEQLADEAPSTTPASEREIAEAERRLPEAAVPAG